MKLGLGNGVANLFDKVQINGKLGDMLRSATYLELLPTPLHNFKATTEWLTEEIFHRYHRPEQATQSASEQPRLSPVEQRDRMIVKALAILAPITFLVATYIGLQTPPSERIEPSQPNSTTPLPSN